MITTKGRLGGGGICAVVTGLLLAVFMATGASATTMTAVTIAGQVSGTVGTAAVTVSVEAFATGNPSSLAGGGMDSNPHGGALGLPPDTCTFPLTGSISGTMITLSGTVTQSTNPTLVGTPVTLMGDAQAGSITFVFDGLTLKGIGTVVIAG